MARELLVKEPPLHLERFDWESFFYVLLWPCVLQEGPNGKLRTDDFNLMAKEMGKWLSSDLRVVGCLKKDIMQIQPGEPDIFRNFLDDFCDSQLLSCCFSVPLSMLCRNYQTGQTVGYTRTQRP